MALRDKLTNNLLCSLILPVICLATILPVPELFSQESFRKLPSLQSDRVRIIEGESYCSTGFGSQTIRFQFEGEHYQSEEISETYLPRIELVDSPFLRIGCNFQQFVVDYSFYEDSVRFDESLVYDDQDYNAVEFRYNNILVGYALTLFPHSLYLDLGLGYSQLQYQFGYYDDNSDTDNPESEIKTHSGTNIYFNLRWFLSVFVYVNWLNQQSLSDTMPVSYTNLLGLNFLVRL